MSKKRIIFSLIGTTVILSTITTVLAYGDLKKSFIDKNTSLDGANENKIESRKERNKVGTDNNKEKKKENEERSKQNNSKAGDEIKGKDNVIENKSNGKEEKEKIQEKIQNKNGVEDKKPQKLTEKEAKQILKEAFNKYFNLNIDYSKIQPNVQFEDSNDERKYGLWILNWTGNYLNEKIYINILIRGDNGEIERIDKFNYSELHETGEKEKFVEEDAKNIAIKFLQNFDPIKLKQCQAPIIKKNSHDGFRVLFLREEASIKNSTNTKGKDGLIVMIDPYTGDVNSLVSIWK